MLIGIPTHSINAVQNIYQNLTMLVRKFTVTNKTTIETKKILQQGCPLSPVLFNAGGEVE
jgi:hypothetical protein